METISDNDKMTYAEGTSQKQKELMRELSGDGQDIKNIFVNGNVLDLTARAYNEDELEDILYYLKIDALQKDKYSSGQWEQIQAGIAKRLEVGIYADPQFSPEQMEVLRDALERKPELRKDICSAADPSYLPEQMHKIIFKGYGEEDKKSDEKKKASSEYHTAKGNIAENERDKISGSGIPWGQNHNMVGNKGRNGLYRYYILFPSSKDLYTSMGQSPVSIRFYKFNYTVKINDVQVWGYVEYKEPVSEALCRSLNLMPANLKIIVIRNADDYKHSVIDKIDDYKNKIN